MIAVWVQNRSPRTATMLRHMTVFGPFRHVSCQPWRRRFSGRLEVLDPASTGQGTGVNIRDVLMESEWTRCGVPKRAIPITSIAIWPTLVPPY